MRRGSHRYRADALIATGATAELWRGTDLELDRPVAIKRPHPHLVDDADTRARFLREARNAARLTHENVVQIFDVGVDDVGPWIAMEFVDGESLTAHLCRTGPLPAAEAAAIGVQIAAALSHAHRVPIVHRDVKPSNVILDASGSVRLVDFGLARLAEGDTLTASGLIAGTPAYMAPEVVRGSPAAPASDVYSLGVVLYELLAGSPPFAGDHPLAVALAHTRDDPPPLPAAGRGAHALERLVALCLAKDPMRRPTSDALEVGLRELAGSPGAGETLVPSGTAATTALASGRRDSASKRPALLLAAVSAAAVAALGLGLAARDGGGPQRGATGGSTSQPPAAAAPGGGTALAPQTTPSTPTPAPAAGDATPGSEALRRVSKLIGVAASTGAIGDGRASKLEERLRDAEVAVLNGDAAAGAASLARLVRESSRGRLGDSPLADDLGGAIRTLAAAWGLNLEGEEDGGDGHHGRGHGDGGGGGDS